MTKYTCAFGRGRRLNQQSVFYLFLVEPTAHKKIKERENGRKGNILR